MLSHFSRLLAKQVGKRSLNPTPLNSTNKMLKSKLHSLRTLFLMYFLLAHLGVLKGASVLAIQPGELDALVKRVCAGKVGECAEEEMMDSESNRRALQMRQRYISYETLRRDLVPCYRPGASYYSCEGPGVANSYGRGCEIITRCARGD